MPPEPMVPKKDCTLVVQLLMELPEDGGVCFYPTPSLQETIPDVDVLNNGESQEVVGLLTCHHYVGDIAPGELQPAANQPSRPDGLDLPFDLVRLSWSREISMTMSLLKLVALWFHKAHLVCASTRNCTLGSAGASRLQTYSVLEKRAETLIFRTESAIIRNELPPEIGELSEPGWDLLEYRSVLQLR